MQVKTLDGKTVWRRRHYRVRRAEEPGTFHFSVLDNGVISKEYWRIVHVQDDLSWGLFYYAGAASVVGQAYRGKHSILLQMTIYIQGLTIYTRSYLTQTYTCGSVCFVHWLQLKASNTPAVICCYTCDALPQILLPWAQHVYSRLDQTLSSLHITIVVVHVGSLRTGT